MRRLSFVAACCMLLLGNLAGSATAGIVERGQPPQPFEDGWLLGAGEACSFPVSVSVTGKSGYMAFEDRIISTSPTARADVTNLETEETVRVPVNGVFRIYPQPDGSEIVVASGQNLLSTDAFAVADGVEPFLLHTTGRLTFFFDF